jgi:hypothetical protein
MILASCLIAGLLLLHTTYLVHCLMVMSRYSVFDSEGLTAIERESDHLWLLVNAFLCNCWCVVPRTCGLCLRRALCANRSWICLRFLASLTFCHSSSSGVVLITILDFVMSSKSIVYCLCLILVLGDALLTNPRKQTSRQSRRQ